MSKEKMRHCVLELADRLKRYIKEGQSIQATVTLTGKCKGCGETISPHVEFCLTCLGDNDLELERDYES